MHPADLKRFKLIRKELAQMMRESQTHECSTLKAIAGALPLGLALCVVRRPNSLSWLLVVANSENEDRLHMPIVACPWCNTLLEDYEDDDEEEEE
jgi:hypothetical protein